MTGDEQIVEVIREIRLRQYLKQQELLVAQSLVTRLKTEEAAINEELTPAYETLYAAVKYAPSN